MKAASKQNQKNPNIPSFAELVCQAVKPASTATLAVPANQATTLQERYAKNVQPRTAIDVQMKVVHYA
jgi:hypothetical protein